MIVDVLTLAAIGYLSGLLIRPHITNTLREHNFRATWELVEYEIEWDEHNKQKKQLDRSRKTDPDWVRNAFNKKFPLYVIEQDKAGRYYLRHNRHPNITNGWYTLGRIGQYEPQWISVYLENKLLFDGVYDLLTFISDSFNLDFPKKVRTTCREYCEYANDANRHYTTKGIRHTF